MIFNERPLVVTMGEPSGIGGEILLKAWLRRVKLSLPPFFVIDDVERLNQLVDRLNWDIPVTEIRNPKEAADVFPVGLPVISQRLLKPVIPGQPHEGNSPAVLLSVRRAVSFVQTGEASAIITNPVHKKTLYKNGFQFPGHTEFLAHLSNVDVDPVMMLACDDLRVVPVTVHQSLVSAISSLNKDIIVEKTKRTIHFLEQDFGLKSPHAVIAGLNPHAGEEGSIGCEELEIISPAVEELKKQGYLVTGPMPADTLFHKRARDSYDVAICMYHDQALIPLKTIDFYSGVNITLGLPFVRTSPDHGTALEIAGAGVADESSILAAIRFAAKIVDNRHSNRL